MGGECPTSGVGATLDVEEDSRRYRRCMRMACATPSEEAACELLQQANLHPAALHAVQKRYGVRAPDDRREREIVALAVDVYAHPTRKGRWRVLGSIRERQARAVHEYDNLIEALHATAFLVALAPEQALGDWSWK